MLDKMKLSHIFSKEREYTILLQGVINPKTFNLWIKNYSDYKVVVSIWEDEDLSNYTIPTNWKIVKNKYPLIRFWKAANLDYQIITTLAGLAEVSDKWVIKMRTDEYYSNLDRVFKRMKENPNKIVSSSMFFRKYGMYKFHCSDKLLGGTTENLLGMFESTLQNLEMNLWNETIPESQLGLGYVMLKDSSININDINNKRAELGEQFIEEKGIKSFTQASNTISTEMMNIVTNDFIKNDNNEIDWENVTNSVGRWKSILSECLNVVNKYKNEFLDDRPYMQKWFDIIDINQLKPYITTRNFGDKRGRVWYNSDFDNEKEDCVSDIKKY
jgi:hypothetical protein